VQSERLQRLPKNRESTKERKRNANVVVIQKSVEK
jgi:hypothetical protein